MAAPARNAGLAERASRLTATQDANTYQRHLTSAVQPGSGPGHRAPIPFEHGYERDRSDIGTGPEHQG